MMDIGVLLDKGIAAVVPKYEEGGGDMVEVITCDGVAAIYPHTVRWAIKRMALYYGIDLDAVKKHYKQMLNIKYNLPVPLAVDMILMPVKVRKPVVSGDSATGFINILQIDDVYEEQGKAYIKFRSGQGMLVLQSINTVRAHIKEANMVRHDFLRCYVERRERNSLWHEIREQYDMPATKGDIAIIADRLMMLMNRLER